MPSLRIWMAAHVPENPPPTTNTFLTVVMLFPRSSQSHVALFIDDVCHCLQRLSQARPQQAAPRLDLELRAVREAQDAVPTAVEVLVLAPCHRAGRVRAAV